MKKYLLSALLFIPSFAWAVCNPFVPNTVLTASALNSAIASPCIVSGTINGVTIDNSAIGLTTPSSGIFTTIRANTQINMGGVLLASITAPTIISGFGTSPSIANNNGTAAFEVNVGTGGTAASGVIGLPTAAHGWTCAANDETTTSATVFISKQIASTASSVTISNYNTSGAPAAWTASDIVHVQCMAY